MNLKQFVLKNQKIIELVKDRVGGHDIIDTYYGTLDYATARFNTILIKLSQDKIKQVEHTTEVLECFDAIQDLYNNVQRYRFWPKIARPFIRLNLYGIGTRRIPKIKNLLDKLDN